jgi:hypothetical protein
MKRTLALLAATTALTAVVGVPAAIAMREPAFPGRGFVESHADGQASPPMLFASDDDDGDDRRRARDDDDDDDDDDGGRGAIAPAPAGTAPPPQNRLFQNGVAPQVKIN